MPLSVTLTGKLRGAPSAICGCSFGTRSRFALLVVLIAGVAVPAHSDDRSTQAAIVGGAADNSAPAEPVVRSPYGAIVPMPASPPSEVAAVPPRVDVLAPAVTPDKAALPAPIAQPEPPAKSTEGQATRMPSSGDGRPSRSASREDAVRELPGERPVPLPPRGRPIAAPPADATAGHWAPPHARWGSHAVAAAPANASHTSSQAARADQPAGTRGAKASVDASEPRWVGMPSILDPTNR